MPKLWLFVALALAGCVSTYMKDFIGKDIRDVMIAEGPPLHTFEMPDGRQAFQWRMGGGAIPLPQSTTTSSSAYVSPGGFVSGNSVTTGFPGAVAYSPGCLVTYIAKRQNDTWIVDDIRYPERLFC